jgi:DNA-binding NtrC family response regulator
VSSGAKSRSTVLVVDDDVQVRAVAARAISDDGFHVLQVSDPVQALAVLQGPEGDDICLVVTDIVMPGMTGDDLGRLLRNLRPTLPVLYISGHSRPAFDFLSETELARCWLAKPFPLSALVTMVRQLCELPSPADANGAPAQSREW